MSCFELDSLNAVYSGLASQLLIERGAKFQLEEYSAKRCKLVYENWLLRLCASCCSIHGKGSLKLAIEAVNGPYYRRLALKKSARVSRGNFETLAISGAVVSLVSGGSHGLWLCTKTLLKLRVHRQSGLVKQQLNKMCSAGNDPYGEYSSALRALHTVVTKHGGAVVTPQCLRPCLLKLPGQLQR